MGYTHQYILPQSSEFVGARSNLFYNLSSSKSLRMRNIIVYSFSEREKDRKIQAMIYEEQLHYKSQLCLIRVGDFL